ncbi:NAD(P)-dependent alcohol dehydrogenase [Halodesulfurarchaeum formicicum]|uniref:Aryl-alcohol dehydrogenase n=1 Tax=Halodesulfurarchaeum formicicum TaxID=1873524 RepID=A0A1J1AFU3_9EURY|nr:NAD(P)-dependent alcohol dehydrogenase [Halodesulfurarchaeum formicicum]APE96489.1 aryl-alcohol dehydrogenase [Halodesulfurarchaeum formicicum]
MTTARAAVVREAGGPFEIEPVELEAPRAGEVRVRIVGVGICHTDLAVRDQHLPTPLPAVLGHEGAGVVETVGDEVSAVTPGDRVVLSFRSDGTCSNCRTGSPAYCADWEAYNFAGQRLTDGSTPITDTDGEPVHGLFFGQSSFGTHAIVDERSLVPVDDDLPLAKLGPLGCGIMTGAGTVMNTLEVGPGDSIAVFGAGSVGLSAVMAANAVGSTDIIAVDVQPGRLATARELGATHTVDASETEDVVEAVREHLGGGAQYAAEMAGKPAVLRQAADVLRPTGTVAAVGAPPMGAAVSLDVNDLLSGRTVTGVTMGGADPREFIPDLLALYRAGKFPFDRLLTEYPFEEIQQAVADHEAGDVIKPVLRVSEP